MTKVKFCGLTRACDIEVVNDLKPEYIGFVFVQSSERYIAPKTALELKQLLDPDIQVVGVFVDEDIDTIKKLIDASIIDIIQLHGHEDDLYIEHLRQVSHIPIIKAFQIHSKRDFDRMDACKADYVLLDSGAGTGKVFDWNWIQNIKHSYFLAGGLNIENIEYALNVLHPYCVDVSSGIETLGMKDPEKMMDFISKVRKGEQL